MFVYHTASLIIKLFFLHSKYTHKFQIYLYCPCITTDQAEHDLRNAQGEFDRQVALVTTICERVISSNTEHVTYLKNFIRAQADYYRMANQHLTELLNETDQKSESQQPAKATTDGT